VLAFVFDGEVVGADAAEESAMMVLIVFDLSWAKVPGDSSTRMMWRYCG
jgi:hypothetical protein